MKVVHCKKEPFDVYIGRPSPWGNPFSDKPKSIAEVKVDSREEAIACYEEWLRQNPDMVAKVKKELKGKILGCWCAPRACHGDALVRIANEDEVKERLDLARQALKSREARKDEDIDAWASRLAEQVSKLDD